MRHSVFLFPFTLGGVRSIRIFVLTGRRVFRRSDGGFSLPRRGIVVSGVTVRPRFTRRVFVGRLPLRGGGVLFSAAFRRRFRRHGGYEFFVAAYKREHFRVHHILRRSAVFGIAQREIAIGCAPVLVGGRFFCPKRSRFCRSSSDRICPIYRIALFFPFFYLLF